MQVHSVHPNTQKSTPRFTGGGNFVESGIVWVMDGIERGGLFASFTVQDMLGTNIPRPIAGLRRNNKENRGKNNIAMALKETIREFTTGPSMFVIPAAIIFGAKRFIGKSLDTPVAFIKGLGGLYKNDMTKQEYVDAVFENVLAGKGINSDQRAKLVENFMESQNEIYNKKHKNKLIGELADKFRDIHKADGSPVADFTSVRLKTGEDTHIDKSAKKFFGYLNDVADDLLTGNKKALEKGVQFDSGKFIDKRIVARFGLNVGMIAAVMAFLSIIPKLYNMTSKGNPGLIGLEPRKGEKPCK